MSADPPMLLDGFEDSLAKETLRKSEAEMLPKVDTSQGMNVISVNTVAMLIKGEINIGKFVIVDCRFDYEFEGGHIAQAESGSTKDAVLKILEGSDWNNTPIIMHCEYSQLRGPAMMKWVRNFDRNLNLENYPILTYPELYLMQGGYAEFFNTYPELCSPSGYVSCKARKNTKALTELKKHSRSIF